MKMRREINEIEKRKSVGTPIYPNGMKQKAFVLNVKK